LSGNGTALRPTGRSWGPVRLASQQARLGEICMKHMTDFTAELDQSGEDIYEVVDEALC
jgi:hypothetical protein